MKKAMAFLLVLCCLITVLSPSVLAEQATAEPIPEPTLSPNAEKYDADHPESLAPDQLYALSAILISASTGEVIF